MELYVHELDKDVLVVAVDGGLNAQTTEQFNVEVDRIAARGFTKIIVDCSALSFISSSGIGALLLLHRRMKAKGVHVKVAIPPSPSPSPRSFVLDVLRITRLDGLFDLYPDVGRARLAFLPESTATQDLDPATRKTVVRDQLKLALAAMPPAQRAIASKRLCDLVLAMPQWTDAQTLLLFWPRVDVDDRPSNAEPDIRPLIDAALAAGKTVALPRVEWASKSIRPARVLAVPDDLEPDPHAPTTGLWQPKPGCATVDLATLDLIVVPGLGFDLGGRRIGRGAGFYDRLLAALPTTSTPPSTPPPPTPLDSSARPFRLGICFDAQIVREIPTLDHDQPMHAVATPSGLLHARTPPEASPGPGIAATPSQ